MVNEQLYAGLKPGQYLQVGSNIKAVTSINELSAWLGDGTTRNPSPQQLAGIVAWVFIALRKRRAQINQTPISWHRGDDELEAEALLEFDPLFQMARVDKAVEVGGVAYLHKLRGGRNQIVGLRWLDPDTIEPDDSSVGTKGYTLYYRHNNGQRISIPADDIIRIYLPGLRELAPDVSAGQASSREAQIIYGMAKTLDSFFETGGLPVLWVDVAAASALESVIRQLKERWNRLLKREGDGTNKLIVTSGGSTVTTISLAPEQLDTTNISQDKADAILSAFGVPAALVHKDVNRAEAELKAEQFADDIVGRLRLYMRIINNDKDVKGLGLSLVAHPERMEVNQRRLLMQAEAVSRLVGSPVMTLSEGREWLGLAPQALERPADVAQPVPSMGITEREVLNGAQMRGAIDIIASYNRGVFPRDNAVLMIETFFNLPREMADKIVPATPGNVDSGSTISEPSKAWKDDMSALRKFIKNGHHRLRWFKSNELADSEIMAEIMELDPMYLRAKTVYP